MRPNLRWLLCLMVVLLAVPAFAQDDSAITLEPFTNETYGIQGVVPAGWQAASPGITARGTSAADVTVLAQQSAALNADALLQVLLPQLRLTEAPESVGTLETPSLTWTLYQVDVDALGTALRVDLALAQGEAASYVVLLQTSPEEYDQLHEQVFLPALNALSPLEAIPEAAEDLPYRQEDVTFDNDDVTLAGTLTLPEGEGPFPVVVLISGSGPQDRDESLAPAADIKPFRLLADGITRAGVAVLRYDDRGVGASTGDFSSATTEDFASDAAAAVDYLLSREDIIPQQIGLLGHSEGGIAAAILGATNPNIAFVIALAGSGVSGADVLFKQNERILLASGAPQEQIDQQIEFLKRAFELVEAEDVDALEQFIEESILAQMEWVSDEEREAVGDLEDFARQNAPLQAAQLMSDWYRFFLEYDPAADWARITVPVLAIFGDLDVQVDSEQNAPAVEAALDEAGNEDVTIVTISGMNHIGQEAETGGVDEYSTLEPTFHPDLLPAITGWLLERVDAAGE